MPPPPRQPPFLLFFALWVWSTSHIAAVDAFKLRDILPQLPSDQRLTFWLDNGHSDTSSSPSSSSSSSNSKAASGEYTSPPWYPTPVGGWLNEWSASYDKAAQLVSRMTLAEKTNITSGTGFLMGRCTGNTGSAPRVSFPQLCLQDSALGVRSTENITAFPAGISVGATFNKELMYARGVALGKEFRGKGINIHLGPSVGPLGRKPKGGRGWEGFGADPVLQGVGAAETIRGVQSQGVVATIKHFIGNEQEMFRMYNPFQPGYSANIDDRTLHELYLWPFAEGIHAGVGAVMAAYNAVNGSACTQNSYLINRILKDELGFQGLIMSDWLAQISGVAAALAGLDMSMPGDGTIPLLGQSWWASHLSEAALNGSVPMERLNDMTTRVVAAWYQLGQDKGFPEPNFSSWTKSAKGLLYPGALISPSGTVNEFVNVQEDHADIARDIAMEAVTLLKNEDNVLPLDGKTPLKVFGSGAQKNPAGINSCPDRGCDKGTLGMGWGSGTAEYPYMDDPISAIKERSSHVISYLTDIFPLTAVAEQGDVALVFISADSGENYIIVEGNAGDRNVAGLHAWHNGDALVKAAADKYEKVVVIVHSVGPILVEEWVDLPSVKSVLFAHLPGQEAGQSLAKVLFGDESPSGHLPYSIPKSEDDYPKSVDLVGFELGQPQDTYSEGLYIDYRHLNHKGIAPRYPFGHGLSYTTFELGEAAIVAGVSLSSTPPGAPLRRETAQSKYDNGRPPASEAYEPAGFVKVWRYIYSWLSKAEADEARASTSKYPYPEGYSSVAKTAAPGGGGQGGNAALWDTAFNVSVTVTNSGSKPGKAVVQAYVQFPANAGVETPMIQLRDFAKTARLEAGESEKVTLTVTRKDVSVWDVQQQNWIVPVMGGEYKVWIGESAGRLKMVCSSTSLSCSGGETGPAG
ncbi:beta-glucosidase 2 precursor [Phyllosticta paracitricarpa]|uniref:beta-glucosidase n=1 Tax=Phyllosticta paracitricarpa TaxID=2016321 RepID=A0ABR1NDH1_9PEZI